MRGGERGEGKGGKRKGGEWKGRGGWKGKGVGLGGRVGRVGREGEGKEKSSGWESGVVTSLSLSLTLLNYVAECNLIGLCTVSVHVTRYIGR